MERRSFRAIIPKMPDVEWIRKLCLSFPDVTEDMPWGDDLCFKIRGKIFTGMVLSDGRTHRERWEELDQLRNRLRLAHGEAFELEVHTAQESKRSIVIDDERPGHRSVHGARC